MAEPTPDPNTESIPAKNPDLLKADQQSQVQCALFIDLFKGSNSYSLEPPGAATTDERKSSYASFVISRADYTPEGYSKDPYFHRIIPMRTSEPSLFMNKLNFSSEATRYLENANNAIQSMDRKLSWIYEKDGVIIEEPLKLSTYDSLQGMVDDLEELEKSFFSPSFGQAVTPEIEAKRNEIINRPWQASKDRGDYYLDSINVLYEGTNPSTARNDVQVTLTFKLESFAALNTVMNPGSDKPIELQELITLPITGRSDGGPGFMIKNQYSPNYNRLRLWVASTAPELERSSLMIDLSIIDHKISRSSEIGEVTLEVNYRGYFEQMMSMPFNDALASETAIDQRKERQEILNETAQYDCDPVTIREILRVDQASLAEERRNRKFSNIIDKMVDRGYIHGAEIDVQEIIDNSGNILNSNALVRGPFPALLDENGPWESRYRTAKKAAGDEVGWTWKELPFVFYEPGVTRAGTVSTYLFYLGDLLEVVSDCLYKKDSDDHRSNVNNINLTFMIADIQIPNANDPTTPLIVNPCCIPISLQFFAKWYNDTIVRKDLAYYPIGTFIRDLVERLITNLLYEVCFSSMLPDEIPPVLRTTYLSDCDYRKFSPAAHWEYPNSGGFYYMVDNSEERPLLSKDIKYDTSSGVQNYCIIYQQTPPYFREMKMQQAGKKPLQDDPTVPTIRYGNQDRNSSYVSNVSFAKSDSPMLREARYFNNQNGNLSLLSNLYDLNFDIDKRKATTSLYPGQIIDFRLEDWGTRVQTSKFDVGEGALNITEAGDSDPHTPGTAANTLGFGGYYIIKRVEYNLGPTPAVYTIKIQTKFLGTDADQELKRRDPDAETIDIINEDEQCAPSYEKMVRHYEDIGGGVEGDGTTTAKRDPDEETFPHTEAGNTYHKVTMPPVRDTSRKTIRFPEGESESTTTPVTRGTSGRPTKPI